MLAFLVVLIAIGYLVLDVAIAKKFELIAGEKGYSGYFWWCFWLGAVGWAMVIALPDRRIALPDYYNRGHSAEQRQTPTPTVQQPSADRLPEL